MPPRRTMDCLLRYCRAGFEPECSEEIAAATAALSISGALRAGSGFVECRFSAALGPVARAELANWRLAIFARQSLLAFEHLQSLPRADRLTPIMAVLAERGERYLDAWVEAPETDEGKALAPFCKSFGNALIGGLKKARLLDPAAPGRLHAF